MAKKLTERRVNNIMKLLNKGDSCLSIGKRYNLSRQIISDIKRGRTWSKITGVTPPEYVKTVRSVSDNIFYGSLTDNARQIYDYILKDYKNKSRENPLQKYTFVQYRAELNHIRDREHFTVFEVKNKTGFRYVCYGDDDTLYTCSWKTLMTRVNAHLAS